MEVSVTTLITFVLYLLLMVGIGVFFFNKSNNLSDYFLGGRGLGSWVTAISAQASDMSGWLLMGLPAAAYISGLSASWIAIGLGLGTYLNWKVVAGRLRSFTELSGDAITIPEYLENRFMSKSKVLRLCCAVIIFIFFLVYTASAFNAGAKLFMYVLGMDSYVAALTIGALIIIAYTFLGGFLAVCWTDLIQGVLMFCAIVLVPVLAVLNVPDFSLSTLTSIAGGSFTSFFNSPQGALSFTAIISSLAWGLGYFGMPHILTRFMAIKSRSLIKRSRLIAMIWVVISLTAAVVIGMVGYVYLTQEGIVYADSAAAEVIFMQMVGRLAPGLLAGVLLSAILAAVMSTADSQLLAASSSVSQDLGGLQRLLQAPAAPPGQRQGTDVGQPGGGHRRVGAGLPAGAGPHQFGDGAGLLRLGWVRRGLWAGDPALPLLEADDPQGRHRRDGLGRRGGAVVGEPAGLQGHRPLLADPRVLPGPGACADRLPLRQGAGQRGDRPL